MMMHMENKKMKEKGIRAELDLRNESIGKKVRSAILERANYMVTIGDQEEEKNSLAVRNREGKVEQISTQSFVHRVLDEINTKCSWSIFSFLFSYEQRVAY